MQALDDSMLFASRPDRAGISNSLRAGRQEGRCKKTAPMVVFVPSGGPLGDRLRKNCAERVVAPMRGRSEAPAAAMMAGMDEHELPPDPDLDVLPPEIVGHAGPMKIVGVDENGNVWKAPTTAEELAEAFADARRLRNRT
jgi:hypothetical protein